MNTTLNIVVLDDNADFACILKELLNAWGYAAFDVPTPEALFDTLKRNQIDLVLLDLWLGRKYLSGHLVRNIQRFSQKKGQDIKVIFISGEESLSRYAEQYKVYGYMDKGDIRWKLFNVLEDLQQKKEKNNDKKNSTV